MPEGPEARPMSEPRKLTRDVDAAKVGGVCAGLADYFAVDVTLVRVITALLVIFTFPAALLAYFVMWLLIPARGRMPSPPAPVVSPPP